MQPCAEQWLDHFERNGVEGVGFGFVYLRRTDSPSDVLAEDLRHGFTDPLGDEAIDYFRRVDWLRNHDVLGARFTLRPDTALERVYLPGEEGWEQPSSACTAATDRGGNTRSTTSPPRCSPECGPTDCRWRTWSTLLAAAHGEDEDALAAQAVSLVQGLVRHGLVEPA